MKRRILKLCAFLLLGAIINVAVAWACAALVPASTASPKLRSAVSIRSWRQSGTDYCQVRRFDTFGRTWITCTRLRSDLLSPDDDVWAKMKAGHQNSPGITNDVGVGTLFPNWTGFQVEIPMHDDRWKTETRLIASSGWPRQCLWNERIDERIFQPILAGPTGGLDIGLPPWSTWQFRDLPAWPIWSGIAINTIFYAAILWLLVVAPQIPSFVRRRIRARRGQCPACAYPVGTSEVCTECGKTIRIQKA